MATAQWQPPADAIPWTPPEDAIPFEGTWDAKLSLDDNILANADPKKLAGYTQIVQRLVPIPGTGLGEHAAAYYIPRQDRALFKALWRKQYASTQPLKQAGYGVRAATSFLQGFMDTGAPLAKMVGALPKLDEDQERFKQELIGERESIDPTIRPDTNVAGRTVQHVGRMAFPAVHMVAGGKVAGGVGKLAGAGKKAVDWLERIGVAASALPQTADQTYSSLVAQGVDADKARTITMFSAPIEAAIESILPDSLSGFRGVFRGTARQVAGKLLRQATVNYTKELSEELAQGIVNETAMEVGRRMDEKIPDKGYGNILLRGLKDMGEAALPLALMMAPGTAVSSTAAVMNSSARPGRLEELRGIRSKGFVSADDGQKAGIPGDTRKARLAAVDEEIAQLEQERKDASQVREDQGVPAAAGQVGEGGEVDRGGDVYQGGEEQIRAESTGEVPPARTEEEVPVAEQSDTEHPPVPSGYVRFYRTDSGTESAGHGWAGDPDYVEAKYGTPGGTTFYIDVPKAPFRSPEYGGYVPAVTSEEDLKRMGVWTEPKKFRTVSAEASQPPAETSFPLPPVDLVAGAAATAPEAQGTTLGESDIDKALESEFAPPTAPEAAREPVQPKSKGVKPIPTSAPPLSHRADKAQRWLANTVDRRPADANTPASLAQWIASGFDEDNYGAYLRESGQTLEQALQTMLPPEPTATPAPLPPVELVAGAVEAAPKPPGAPVGDSDIDKALESEFAPPTAPEAAREPVQPKSKGVNPTPVQQGAKLTTGRRLKGWYNTGLDTAEFVGTVTGITEDTAGGRFATATVELDSPMILRGEPRTSILVTLDDKGAIQDSKVSADKQAVYSPPAPPPKNRGKKPPAFTQPDEQTLQTLANAQITLKATAKGWVAAGIPEEMADGLKADFQGRKLGGGRHLFKSDPTPGLLDAAGQIAAEAEQTAAAEASGLARTRIGTLTPEQAAYYEQQRQERIDALTNAARSRQAGVDELLSQFVPKKDRGKFALQLRNASDRSDADTLQRFDEIVEYAKDHPELGLPATEQELFELLVQHRATLDEKAIAEQVDNDLAKELDQLISEEHGEAWEGEDADTSWDFGEGMPETPATSAFVEETFHLTPEQSRESPRPAPEVTRGVPDKPGQRDFEGHIATAEEVAAQEEALRQREVAARNEARKEARREAAAQKSSGPDFDQGLLFQQKKQPGLFDRVAARKPEVASLAPPTPTRQSRSTRQRVAGEQAGVAAADIAKTVERTFGVAVRQGGFSKRAAGIYKWLTRRNGPPSPEVVRTTEDHYANMAVLAHEVAHHVDEKAQAVKSMPKAVREEVQRLDYEPKGRAFEGWAEFLRRYITEPPLGVAGQQVPNPGLDAPRTLAWFEKTFLPAHPDFAASIGEFRQQAQEFAQQSVWQRVGTLIADRQPQDLSFKDRWLKKSRRWLNRLKTNYVDKFHALKWIQDEAERRGHEGVGIYDLTMAHYLAASSHATTAFEEGVRSLRTGELLGEKSLWGLRDHLESDGEYQDAVLYALARHTLFMDEAKPGYNTGMDAEDAEAWISEVQNSGKAERYEAFARDLAAFNNDLIHMLVDAGALPASEANTMLKYYGDLNYFPLHRVQDAERGLFAGSGVGFVNLGRAVRKRSAKGSGRQIIDPLDATVARAIRFYGRAIQARQQHVLADTLDPLRGGVGGMGGLMDRVDPRKKVTQGTLGEILKTLVDEEILDADDAKAMRIAAKLLHPEAGEEPSDASLKWFAERHGIDLEGDDIDMDVLLEAAREEPDAMAVISLWRPDYTPSAQKRTVLIYDEQGNPLMYEMDPDLYATATGLDDLQFGPFMSMMREGARYFKSGAVSLSTGFGTANLLRDYWEFQGKARHVGGLSSLGKPPEMLGRYVAEKARKLAGHEANDPLIRLYEESGGKVYSVIGHDVHSRRMYRRRRIGISTMSKLGLSLQRPVDSLEGALQGVQDLIGISDAPPRLADAEAAIKESGYEIRDGQWFDTQTGVAVESLPEEVRIKAAVAMAEATINFKRIGAKGQYIEAFLPFFNATVQASYRQYQQLKGLRSLGAKDVEGMRAKRYLVYLSALAATGVAYWLLRHNDDDWREQDAYLRDGYWTWGANGKTYLRIPKPRDTAIVSNVVENMLDHWYHDDARDTSDVVLREFGGRLPTGGGFARGVVETYVADYDYFRNRPLTPDYVKHLPKEQQITPYTTRASDSIGSVTGRYFGTSPIQVEHLLNSASGGLYHRLADLYDASVDGRLGPEHIPFLRGLVINRQQARSVDDFYQEKAATDTAALREQADGELSEATIRKQAVLEWSAEIMTKLRELESKTGKRRSYEYQPYITGLARASLGFEDLPSDPNPLTNENVPDAVKTVIHDYASRAVNQAGQVEKEPSSYKTAEDYASARKSRLRGEAIVKTLNLTHDKAQQLLVESFRRPDSKGKKQSEMRRDKPGKFDPGYKAKALALARLYGLPESAFWDWRARQ